MNGQFGKSFCNDICLIPDKLLPRDMLFIFPIDSIDKELGF